MIQCTCGYEHKDEARVAQCGWRKLSKPGDFARLVQCKVCTSHIVAEILSDASQCANCRRLVTGRMDDPHVYVSHVNGALCLGCFCPDKRRFDWLEWKSGGPKAISVNP